MKGIERFELNACPGSKRSPTKTMSSPEGLASRLSALELSMKKFPPSGMTADKIEKDALGRVETLERLSGESTGNWERGRLSSIGQF